MDNQIKPELIDLDELLHGDPTWQQVQEFFQYGEFCEERYDVEAIEKHLLTEEQRIGMFNYHLSIEKMLNGRYPCQGKEKEFVYSCYEAWNAKLGFKAFGY